MSDSICDDIVIRGRRIREDKDGLICLDDIWSVAKSSPTREPKRWRALATTKRLEEELRKKVVIRDLKTNSGLKSVAYAKVGRGNSGTFAHPIMAAAYAGYLSPKLRIEVLEVWLRFRKGDATLADEILQKASPGENRWVAIRAMGRAKRITFTDTLKEHEVIGSGYARCTDAIYGQILGAPAQQLKKARGLSKKASLRDNMEISELTYVMAAESLATDRIVDEDSRGNFECARASERSAGFIREAIERDKRDRQRRLPST